jgi:hypothetical protein
MAKSALFAPVGSTSVDLCVASERQPLGTVAILFRRVPVLGVPRAWRRVKIDLHTQVHLRRTERSGVAIYAPMRSGFAARFFGSKLRAMGELPPEIADTLLVKLGQGASLRARLVDVPPPCLRQDIPEMGFYISIRCRS